MPRSVARPLGVAAASEQSAALCASETSKVAPLSLTLQAGDAASAFYMACHAGGVTAKLLVRQSAGLNTYPPYVATMPVEYPEATVAGQLAQLLNATSPELGVSTKIEALLKGVAPCNTSLLGAGETVAGKLATLEELLDVALADGSLAKRVADELVAGIAPCGNATDNSQLPISETQAMIDRFEKLAKKLPAGAIKAEAAALAKWMENKQEELTPCPDAGAQPSPTPPASASDILDKFGDLLKGADIDAATKAELSSLTKSIEDAVVEPCEGPGAFGLGNPTPTPTPTLAALPGALGV